MITEQYLQYLEWMKIMNIDYAGDFIVMASTLTQIKSRMLLPTHEDQDEDEDPRQEIVRPLLEYLQMKSAAEQLAERSLLGDSVFVRQPKHERFLTNPEDEIINIGLFELIDAFQKILEKIPSGDRIEFTPDRISVKDRINQIVDILEEKGSITFPELFSEKPDKAEVIVTFLALLEMVKLALVRLVQHVHSSVIRLFYQ
jgi:segregation and condensation protein A